MTRRLGLRTRLTLLVTGVFAVALTLTSVVVTGLVEDDLIADTEASAERVLANYLETINGGTATIGVVDSTTSTRFFYLDERGDELSELEYFQTIAIGIDPTIAVQVPDFLSDQTSVASGVIASSTTGAGFGPLELDAVTGQLIGPTGTAVTFVSGPVPVGVAHSVDMGPGVVGVAQTLRFGDGTTFEVGVSNPLQPVTKSLDTIRRILWFGVPLVVAAIAMATWLAASRALAPVHAITERARDISAENIADRVPVPAGNDEIRELAQTMNSMLGRLEASQQRQRRLVADVSHELRSPVAATRAQLEVAQADPAHADWASTAATVLAEQENLSQLIDDLLALSRIEEAGPRTLTDVDLDEVVEEEARRPHPAPVSVGAPKPVRVSADRGLVSAAVRNLVENAARHAHERVEVSVSDADGFAVIHVDDDGDGVPIGSRDLVFERFARLDESRTRASGGAGLGLAIVDGVARAHGGEVTIADSPLGGARFSFSLPLPAEGLAEIGSDG